MITSLPSIRKASWPATWPGISIASIASPPDWIFPPPPIVSVTSYWSPPAAFVSSLPTTGTPKRSASFFAPTTWSQC